MIRVVPVFALAALLAVPVLASAQSPNYVQQLNQQPNSGYTQNPNYVPNQVQAPYRRSTRYGAPVNTDTQQTQTQQTTTQQMPMQPQRMQRATAPISGRYTTADMARSACGGDQVVWANINTKVYHMQDSSFFGKTKHGAFMCERNADAGGFHASKGG